MRHIVELFFLVTWVAGVVIASGFWSTLFAVLMPMWAWYLMVERGLNVLGWI